MKDLWPYWQRNDLGNWALMPLSVLYCTLNEVRRHLYRGGFCHVHQLPLPVIVVGNITVGGTGKTPFVVWLCTQLRAAGLHPGIVLRGYGGRNRGLLAVTPRTDPALAGDEAVLLARRAGVPVMACRDRPRGARGLLSEGCDVVIADDGLQHYRLGRRVEIGMLDGRRRFGNGYCLPSGPLRERRGRWDSLDFRVTQGAPAEGEWGMRLEGTEAYALDGSVHVPVETLKRVHAVAGIGHPDRFFTYLERLGLQVVAHAFADHHNYTARDLVFDSDDPIIMTEKDAVKCERFAQVGHWYLPVTAAVDPNLAQRILVRITA